VTYALVQFSTLEWLRVAGSSMVHRPLTTRENALVGFLVGVITSVLTEPIDVVRTRLIGQKRRAGAQGPGSARAPPTSRARSACGPAEQDFGYTGLLHGLRQIVRSEGVGALWRGLLPRLLLKAVGSMIWYPVYMRVLRLAS